MTDHDCRAPLALSDAPVAPAVVLRPGREILAGSAIVLEPLDPRRHGDDLFAVADGAPDSLWDYLPYGPFHERKGFDTWLSANASSADPVFYALRDTATGRAAGMTSFLNIVPANRSIEVGHIWFGPALQKTRAATQAIYLMIAHAFDDLGYRRVEWKCNALNARSRAAALRFGFRYEGLFLRHMITKGRNRDTAWYGLVIDDWAQVKAGFADWLDDGNFGDDGRQKARLSDLIAGAPS